VTIGNPTEEYLHGGKTVSTNVLFDTARHGGRMFIVKLIVVQGFKYQY